MLLSEGREIRVLDEVVEDVSRPFNSPGSASDGDADADAKSEVVVTEQRGMA